MFWYSIRIYKVLIALQSMAPCGFIDGLRKTAMFLGTTVVVVFVSVFISLRRYQHQGEQQQPQQPTNINSRSNNIATKVTATATGENSNGPTAATFEFWIFGFQILDFRFLISDFGLVYSSFSFWQPQTVRWGFGFRVLDLQFLPKFGFCMRYTRPRGFGSARIYSNASFV